MGFQKKKKISLLGSGSLTSTICLVSGTSFAWFSVFHLLVGARRAGLGKTGSQSNEQGSARAGILEGFPPRPDLGWHKQDDMQLCSSSAPSAPPKVNIPSQLVTARALGPVVRGPSTSSNGPLWARTDRPVGRGSFLRIAVDYFKRPPSLFPSSVLSPFFPSSVLVPVFLHSYLGPTETFRSASSTSHPDHFQHQPSSLPPGSAPILSRSKSQSPNRRSPI